VLPGPGLAAVWVPWAADAPPSGASSPGTGGFGSPARGPEGSGGRSRGRFSVVVLPVLSVRLGVRQLQQPGGGG
jgi:hypothetical protein